MIAAAAAHTISAVISVLTGDPIMPRFLWDFPFVSSSIGDRC